MFDDIPVSCGQLWWSTGAETALSRLDGSSGRWATRHPALHAAGEACEMLGAASPRSDGSAGSIPTR